MPQATQVPSVTGKGRLSISSQPAAEIFINNRKVGTTVDGGSSSGWIAVETGAVTVVLRRAGYRDLVKKITVTRDDRITMGILTLEREGAPTTPGAASKRALNSAPNVTLTVTTNRWPANVTLINNGAPGSAPTQFRIDRSSKTVRIPQGRFTIRVEANGEVKERRLDTTTVSGAITYSVEFSGSANQKAGMPGGEREP